MTATHRTFKLHGFQFVIQVDGFADQPSQAHALQEFKAGLRELAPCPETAACLYSGTFSQQEGYSLDADEAHHVFMAQRLAAGLASTIGANSASLALKIDL